MKLIRNLSLLMLLCVTLASVGAAQVTFRDITRQAGISFVHNNGAAGKKWLPETMGVGCAFIDYDNDGYPDILLVNGKDWTTPGKPSTLKLYHNNRNGTFTDVTAKSGLGISLFGMGAAVADYDNDGFDDIYVSALGPTPTGVSKGMMDVDDLIVADMQGKKLSGRKECTSEVAMHMKIYEMRPDIHAVLHAHPPVATGFAAAGRPLNLALLRLEERR